MLQESLRGRGAIDSIRGVGEVLLASLPRVMKFIGCIVITCRAHWLSRLFRGCGVFRGPSGHIFSNETNRLLSGRGRKKTNKPKDSASR